VKIDLAIHAKSALSEDLKANFTSTFQMLTELADEATHFGTLGDNCSVRRTVDKLKQVWSSLPQDFMAVGSDVDPQSKQKLSEQVLHFEKRLSFISAWSKRFETLLDNAAFQKSEEGLQYLIDSRLPPIWNWDKDVVVLFSSKKDKLAKLLAERGQKNIYIVRGRVTEKSLDHCGEIFHSSGVTLAKRIAVIETPASDRQSRDIVKVVERLKKFRSLEASIRQTNKYFAKPNVLQRLENSAAFTKTLSYENLRDQIAGKPVVIVSPGPSLAKNIKLLAEKAPNVVIVAVAQAVPALLKHNIQPDYVVVIDNQSFSKITKGLNYQATSAIFVDTVHQGFFNHPFKNIYVNLNNHTPDALVTILKERKVNILGGSVSVFAFNVMVSLDASEIALIGQDLAVSEGDYYVGDGWHSFDTEPEELFKLDGVPTPKRVATHLLPGYYGGMVGTRADYWIFYEQFLTSACSVKASDKKIKIYNCTEGGAFIEGFMHEPFGSFLEKFCATELNKTVESILISKQEVNRRRVMLIGYLNDIKSKCLRMRALLKEGQEIFSGKKDIKHFQNNSTKIHDIILDSAELSSMAYRHFEELDRRLSRNKNIKSDKNVIQKIYSDISADCDALVAVCNKELLLFNQHP
jgi:hypothetical protein